MQKDAHAELRRWDAPEDERCFPDAVDCSLAADSLAADSLAVDSLAADCSRAGEDCSPVAEHSADEERLPGVEHCSPDGERLPDAEHFGAGRLVAKDCSPVAAWGLPDEEHFLAGEQLRAAVDCSPGAERWSPDAPGFRDAGDYFRGVTSCCPDVEHCSRGERDYFPGVPQGRSSWYVPQVDWEEVCRALQPLWLVQLSHLGTHPAWPSRRPEAYLD